MHNNIHGAIPQLDYLDLTPSRHACQLSNHDYGAIVAQISDEGSISSVETYLEDEHVSSRARIAFHISSDSVYVTVGQRVTQIEKISDLPGIDRVLRPSNSSKLSSGQVRVYKKWSHFLMTVQVYFTGTFACVNGITGVSSDCPVSVQADRPVPFHRDFIPDVSIGFKVCSLGLRRSIGRRVYHVSSSGTVSLADVSNEVVYLGSGRLRSVYSESESSSDDDCIGATSDADVDEDTCECETLVSRYREIAAKYNLGVFADQVLRDCLQNQIKKRGSEDDEYAKQVHVCRKYRIPGFLEASESIIFEAFLHAQSNSSRHGRRVYRMSALRFQELVDLDSEVCSGEYQLIRINVRRRFFVTRREVRKVREICTMGSCVCEIARKSHLSIQEVHDLLLKVPGSHTNHIFGACYANRDGVYSGDRTGNEPECVCLANALRLRDVVGVICNQFGRPISTARSGLYPVIELRGGYVHICSWSKEDTLMPNGIDLDTKIAGFIGL